MKNYVCDTYTQRQKKNTTPIFRKKIVNDDPPYCISVIWACSCILVRWKPTSQGTWSTNDLDASLKETLKWDQAKYSCLLMSSIITHLKQDKSCAKPTYPVSRDTLVCYDHPGQYCHLQQPVGRTSGNSRYKAVSSWAHWWPASCCCD